MLVAGLVLTAFPETTKQRGKRIREHRHEQVTPDNLARAIASYQLTAEEQAKSLAAEKQRLIREYIDAQRFKSDFLEPLREDILRGLAFVHDYKQINTQISQNINVLIESRYQGATFEEKLGKAREYEKAIYHASKFLEEKLNVAKFLLNPEWLMRAEDCVLFRFHGAVHKYLRIYEPLFARKQLRKIVTGTSFADVLANPQATSIIPHTLIDNAVKYAPVGSRVEVGVDDGDGFVNFVVRSVGPQILPHELSRIFDPFYRGDRAREAFEEGSGYGLYVSQLVAREHLGTEIHVRQTPTDDSDGFLTEFAVRVPLRAKIVF
ncbi:MAG: sensor histidine kinase [Thermoanaerobaculia bacterium]